MNTELTPILLNSEFDEWIIGNLMYEPSSGGYYRNWVDGVGYYDEVAARMEIKDSGKVGSERIYRALKEIEKVKGIKL
jgi:hypothetical protein